MHYDVIVIGGGPAGATAATFLALRDHRVLLLEKSRFPRHKLCGEFITPECMTIFDRLGVKQRMFDAGAKYIRHMTLYAPDGRNIYVPMTWIADGHPHAIGLTRARMDLILLDRAREAGVDVREEFHVAATLAHDGGVYYIEGKSTGGSTERFSAPVIVDASGRNGVFSKKIQQTASTLDGARLFGCKVHLRNVREIGEIGELFFFKDGYGGISDVEDDENGPRSNLCFLTTESTLRKAKGDREKLLDHTLLSNPAANKRLASAIIDGEWLGTGPISYGQQRSMKGVLAIGDAGAFIDPFTGSGILLALTSGEMAAKVINQAIAEGINDINHISAEYHRFHKRQFGWRFRACSALRKLAFNPLARNAFVSLASRNQSVMRVIALGTRQRTPS